MVCWLFAIFFFSLSAAAQRIEIYEDWLPDASGTSAFEKPEQGVSFHYAIRAALEERGYSVRNWDRKAHLPWLLTWKQVRSWDDFKSWTGFGHSRKEVLEPDTAYLVFSGVGLHLKDLDLSRIPKDKLILFLWEPPTVQPEPWDPKIQRWFHKIYTWNDDLVDGIRFFKFHLPSMKERIEALPPYEERKFLTLIASRLSSKHPKQLYSEREKLIRFFEARPKEEFDLYGRFWEKRKFRCWKGTIPEKMNVLKQYRFAIAYENSAETGYVTEKLWDCFAAGAVPIYWGAPNIAEIVPPDCFIDRRKFSSDEELLAFLKAMKQEEWGRYVERAGEFLKSKAAAQFTYEAYARTVAEAVTNPSFN